MKKPLYLILIVLAIGLIAYNITLVNFKTPLEGDSVIALVGIAASSCAIVLILLFLTSKKIEDKINED